MIHDFIFKTLRKKKVITFEEISDLAEVELTAHFDGKVLWYQVSVKPDIEARGCIERIPKTCSHPSRLTK